MRFTRTYDIEKNIYITKDLRPATVESGLKQGSFLCHGVAITPPQTSIHPRVVKGVTVHKKVNTANGKKK